MEPSSSPTMSRAPSNHGSRMRESTVKSREATPATMKVQTIISLEDEESVQNDSQLALGFKDDLISMRKYLTCSICVQLLYEPWILQCGHTYCYNCLCQWFIPNRRKKTCPECRAPVKQIPAPAFLVKNLVEIFINRGQLMPYDETVEQHKINNAEVTEMVEKDKNSTEGLFGGSFPKRHGELWRDEADGVMRCPSCGHEHEGGPTCDICGAEFDDIYGFSDMDDDGDLSDIDVGYDEDAELEIGAEFQMDADNIANLAHIRHNHRHYAFGGPAHQHILNHYHAHHLAMDDTEDDSEDVTNSDTSNQDNSEDEDAGSLEDFIAPEDDDSEPITHQRRVNRVVTIISDEEEEEEDEDEDDESEDEGGAITNRRRRRPGWTRSSENPSRSISISEDGNGSSTNGSEFGDDDAHETRMRLRASGGWSPLDEGDEEDNNGLPHDDYRGYATAEDERASDESDSETIGNPNSDAEDDDDRSRQGLSETPRYGNADFEQFHDDYTSSIDGDATPIDYRRDRDDESHNYGSESENRYEYDTDGDHSTNMDRDGDTEMSVSPSVSRSSRDLSVESNYGENLGVANEMAEVDDDLSDTSIGFGSRRQPRRNPVVQQYDPRISMLFAEHQNTVRNAQNPEDMSPWGDDLNRNIRVEPASRSRRRGQNHHQALPISNNGARNSHHRIIQPHGLDRVRISRGSPPRVIPVSSRNNRLQRQYPM